MPQTTLASSRKLPLIVQPRCTGHCCKRFFLPYLPSELEQIAERCDDGPQIAAMVIPLGPPTEEDQRPGVTSAEAFQSFAYTCRNLLPNGDCAVYADRPKMCRDYPYEGRCVYPGCTAKG